MTEIRVFTDNGLERLMSLRDDFANAQPFRHLALDNLFDTETLRRVVEEYPVQSTPAVEMHSDGTFSVNKGTSTWRTKHGPNTQEVLRQMNEAAFLQALQVATGIEGLISDPYFFGGGTHFTSVGGKLAVHADFNRHRLLKLDRRLNVLVYLNDGWTEENQGWLELWDREMTACQRRFLPVMNRTVIFATDDYSYHGQPEVIKGPPDLIRRSIALYYYTNGRPAEEVTGEDHLTLWRERPGRGY